MKVKKLDEYGTILLNITGADSTAVVELLDGSGKVLRQQRITPQNTADFYYLNPGTKFYIRLFNDRNGNGVWDTGSIRSTYSLKKSIISRSMGDEGKL